ncbi:hypothetical protein HDU87_008621 [Geranomyces variabilis]|uniref:Uncharacterized protein n=1 Tax=Geranomyces variabilis TaxID=109894 RepID=A0AAD5TF63_9FUNG|nr:hypothetical protein HDU87_008621 [Geranomyces variabilis]
MADDIFSAFPDLSTNDDPEHCSRHYRNAQYDAHLSVQAKAAGAQLVNGCEALDVVTQQLGDKTVPVLVIQGKLYSEAESQQLQTLLKNILCLPNDPTLERTESVPGLLSVLASFFKRREPEKALAYAGHAEGQGSGFAICPSGALTGDLRQDVFPMATLASLAINSLTKKLYFFSLACASVGSGDVLNVSNRVAEREPRYQDRCRFYIRSCGEAVSETSRANGVPRRVPKSIRLSRQFAERCFMLHMKSLPRADWWFNGTQIISVSSDFERQFNVFQDILQDKNEQVPLVPRWNFSNNANKSYYGEVFHVAVLTALYPGMADRFCKDSIREVDREDTLQFWRRVASQKRASGWDNNLVSHAEECRTYTHHEGTKRLCAWKKKYSDSISIDAIRACLLPKPWPVLEDSDPSSQEFFTCALYIRHGDDESRNRDTTEAVLKQQLSQINYIASKTLTSPSQPGPGPSSEALVTATTPVQTKTAKKRAKPNTRIRLVLFGNIATPDVERLLGKYTVLDFRGRSATVLDSKGFDDLCGDNKQLSKYVRQGLSYDVYTRQLCAYDLILSYYKIERVFGIWSGFLDPLALLGAKTYRFVPVGEAGNNEGGQRMIKRIESWSNALGLPAPTIVEVPQKKRGVAGTDGVHKKAKHA